jgi:hypothetical protein
MQPEQHGLSPEEQFTTGLELLKGPQSDRDLPRALSLIEAASAAGVADGTEKLALFEAMGIARPPSWERAFDRLQLAAEQGSASARRQLLLLANPARDPESGQAVADWADLRRRISLDELLRSGERQALANSPRIRVIRKFASTAECRWLIDRASDRLKPAMIYDRSGAHVRDPGRSNSATEFQVPDMDLVLEVIRARIAQATRVPLPVFELTQIFHYSPGEEFKLHHDFLDPDNAEHRKHLATHGQRIATFLIYLNEGFDGGETEFPQAGIRFRGNVGDAIFWANVGADGEPDRSSVHMGRPPSTGEKWILSQWLRDRAATPGSNG